MMTEKRYIVDVDESIIDTKTNREYTTWDISGVEDICDKLNNLTDENEQLRKESNRLYNYFEDWYNDMTSANDFSEIWDNVKDDERWD